MLSLALLQDENIQIQLLAWNLQGATRVATATSSTSLRIGMGSYKPGQYYSYRAPTGPILLGASPPDPPAFAFGLHKVGLRPPWVPVRAGWAQKVGLRPPWVPIRAGWAQNGTPYGFPKNWKSKMDPKWIQNGPFGVKLGPNESESTPGPFSNPPGPKNPHKNQTKTKNPKIPKTFFNA